MKTYDFVHLVLYAAGGKIEGRTKLQKVVYFAGVLTKADNLGYGPHFYGPYSPDVTVAIDRLRALKFVKQSAASGGAVDTRGFEVTRYDYVLTSDGKLIAEEKTHRYERAWRKIKAAVNRILRCDPIDYVKLSIAAKTFFMQGRLKESTSHRELEQLASRLGWKVTSDEIAEAFEWLKGMHLVADRSID